MPYFSNQQSEERRRQHIVYDYPVDVSSLPSLHPPPPLPLGWWAEELREAGLPGDLNQLLFGLLPMSLVAVEQLWSIVDWIGEIVVLCPGSG